MALSVGQIVVLLNSDPKEFNAGLLAAERRTKQWERETTKARRAVKRFAKETATAALRLAAFAAPIAALAAVGGIARVVQQTLRWNQELTNLSLRTGISIEQMQRYNLLIGAAGLEARDLANGINRLNERMIDFNRGNAEIVDSFTEIGLATAIGTGEIRTQEEAINALARAYVNLSAIDPAAASGLLGRILGAGQARRLEPLFQRFGGDLSGEAALAAQAAGGITTREQSDALERVTQTLLSIGDTLDTGFRRLTAEFAADLERLADAINESVRAVVDRLVGDGDSPGLNQLQSDVRRLVAIIEATIVTAFDNIPELIEGIFRGLRNLLTISILSLIGVLVGVGLRAVTTATMALGVLSTRMIAFAQFLAGFVGFAGLGSLFGVSIEDLTNVVSGTRDLVGFTSALTSQFQANLQAALDRQVAATESAADEVVNSGQALADAMANARQIIVNQVDREVAQAFSTLRLTVGDLRAQNQTGGLTGEQQERQQFLRDTAELFNNPIVRLETSMTRLDGSVRSLLLEIAELGRIIRGFDSRVPQPTGVPRVPEQPQVPQVPPVPPTPTPLPGPPDPRLGDDIELPLERFWRRYLKPPIEAIRRFFAELLGITEAEAQVRPFDFPIGVLPDRIPTPPPPDAGPAPRRFPLPGGPLPETVDAVAEERERLSRLLRRLALEYARIAETGAQLDRLRGLVDVSLQVRPPTGAEETELDALVKQGLAEISERYRRQRIGIQIGLFFDNIQGQRNFNRQIADAADQIDLANDRLIERLQSTGQQQVRNDIINQLTDAYTAENLSRIRNIADLQLQLEAANRMAAVGVEGAADRVLELKFQIEAAEIGLTQFQTAWENNQGAMMGWADEAARTTTVLQQMEQLSGAIEGAFTTAFENIIFEGQNLGDAFKQLVNEIIREIIRIAIIRPLVQNIATGLTGAFGGGVGAFATGGLARGLAVVGERGPELVDFRNPGRVYSNSQIRAALGSQGGGGGGNQLTFHIQSSDGPGVRQALAEAIPAIVAASENRIAEQMADRNSGLAAQVRARARE